MTLLSELPKARGWGVDLSPAALAIAERNAGQLRLLDRVALRQGSWDAALLPEDRQPFDLIVSNPPYVMSPPDQGGQRLVYRENNFIGDGLVETVVRQAPSHLTPGGTLQVLANWAITGDQPWEDRLSGWAPAGADMWVIERERLDPYAYIELWLTDAGLAGDPSWSARYREWLDYFTELGIRAIGMGWITITNAGRQTPDITIESWPHAVHQPLGPAIAARQRDITAARASSISPSIAPYSSHCFR